MDRVELVGLDHGAPDRVVDPWPGGVRHLVLQQQVADRAGRVAGGIVVANPGQLAECEDRKDLVGEVRQALAAAAQDVGDQPVPGSALLDQLLPALGEDRLPRSQVAPRARLGEPGDDPGDLHAVQAVEVAFGELRLQRSDQLAHRVSFAS